MSILKFIKFAYVGVVSLSVIITILLMPYLAGPQSPKYMKNVSANISCFVTDKEISFEEPFEYVRVQAEYSVAGTKNKHIVTIAYKFEKDDKTYIFPVDECAVEVSKISTLTSDGVNEVYMNNAVFLLKVFIISLILLFILAYIALALANLRATIKER